MAASSGTNAGASPAAISLPTWKWTPPGDVYASGIGIDLIDKFSTIKLRGSDGALLWQAYDEIDNDHSVSGLFLDGVGGVFSPARAIRKGTIPISTTTSLP